MTLLVDTTVWSLALRRDAHAQEPEVQAPVDALVGRFAALGLVQPARDDYIAAAAIRNTRRTGGVQSGTLGALIAQLCIGNDLTLLTTDQDFSQAARHCSLNVWSDSGRVRRKRPAK